MKIRILILSLLFLSLGQLFSQEETSAFKYHSFSFSPLGLFNDGNTEGLLFNTDLSFAYKENHLFSLAVSYASETQIVFGGFNDQLIQYNLFYGREFKMNNTVFIDVHAGLGCFSYKSEDVDRNREGVERNEAIGLPLLVKLRFKTGDRFSLGFQIQSNINTVNSMVGVGIVLQWNKRKEREQ